MKARKLLLAVMTIASITLFNACTEDACEGETCSGNGTPVESAGLCSCDCDNGYSGSNCEIEDLCITQNVTCLNGGTCDDGTCDCAAGYEGDSCQIVSRLRFVFDNYNVTEICSLDSCGTTLPVSAPAYISSITNGANINEVKIDNFGNYGLSSLVVATVNGFQLTIAAQTVGGVEFSGSGTMNQTENQIAINYTVTDGCQVITCNATYVK